MIKVREGYKNLPFLLPYLYYIIKNLKDMKPEKRKNVDIINDIINILNQSKDEDSIEDFYHIDNLREEIEEQPHIFRYTLEEFDNVVKTIFK